MEDYEKSKDELIQELVALRQRVNELEQQEIEHQQVNSQQILFNNNPEKEFNLSPTVDVVGINFKWYPSEGICTLSGLPVAIMWIDTTLAAFMSGLQAMVGTERFCLALQSEGRKSVEADWEVISQYPSFAEGIAALNHVAVAAGWGSLELISIDWEHQECKFRVINSWESLYQKSLGVCWGSSMLAGKLAGYCSKLFQKNCWSEQTSFISRGGAFDEFIVKPSDIVIEEEIDKLLLTDQATRADLAVAVEQLRREVTERQQVEIALRESEERLRLALDAAQMGFWDWDVPNNKVTWSENKERLFGFTPGSFSGTYEAFLDCIHPEDRELTIQRVAIALKEHKDYNDEFRIIWSDGSIHWIFAKGQFFYDKTKQPLRMVGVCMDVTSRKQAEQLLVERTEILENQQAWLEDALNFMPTPLLFIEPGTAKVTFASKAANEMAGGEFPKDKPGEEYHTIYYCTDADGNRIPDEQMPGVRVARGERLHGFEMNWHTSGDVSSIILFADTLPAMHGHPATCVVVFQDISDVYDQLRLRKRAEKALQESEERFRQLTEKVSVIPWEADATTGIFTYVGPQVVDILGYAIADWYTDNFWFEHIHPEDADWAIKLCTDSSAYLDNYEFEYRMLSADGEVVWLYDIVNVVREQNQPKMLRGFMIDITKRKQVEEERIQLLEREQAARESAEAANRMKDEFLSILSHELRTPLNSILGWSRLLSTRQMDSATITKGLQTIERNASVQAQLIEDILDVSRIITGKLRLKVRPVDITGVIKIAIDTMRPAIDAKEIDIQILSDSPIDIVSGDPDRLQQVIWNLLSNAVKFTPRHGRIEVRVECINSQIQISVTDTGQGINPDFLPYVFERFRQADSTSTRSQGGLGLGLAIVRHLVELHGGTVEVQSLGEGQGSTFTVRLPVMTVRHKETDIQLSTKTESNEVFNCSRNLEGLKVLVVDDQPDARELLTTVLQECGAEVTAVASAKEVINVLQQLKPDVLISDIGMPEQDGYSLLRQIRSLAPENGGQIPAAALTAYARDEDRKQALLAGFQAHLSKPVDPNELIAVVASLTINN